MDPSALAAGALGTVQSGQMRVWFNKSFSGTVHLVRALKSAGAYVLASHTGASAMLVDADQQLIEDRGLSGEAYVRWALEMAVHHRIDVLVPGKEANKLAQARALFGARGVKLLIAAEPEVLSLLADKARFYAGFDPSICAVLPFRVVTTVDEFSVACAELGAEGPICMKPVRGVFGQGFRSLVTSQSLERLLEGDLTSLSRTEAERIFSSSGPKFRPMLVMRYAGGAERSIDCLGHQGELVRAVMRRKQSGSSVQVLEDNPQATEIARRATAAYGLTGIYNVQTKDVGGVPHILEINPRASGGIQVAMTSGLNFPLWSVKLLMGLATPAEVPVPRTGLQVAQISAPVVVGP